MLRSLLRALVIVVLFTWAPAAAEDRHVTVMTRNLYLGADLAPILAASADILPVVVGDTWAAVQASDPEARMAAIADEIARTQPDLVGLQEASLWRTGSITAPVATDVAFDFIALLVNALAARGEAYEVAGELVNLDVQLPGLTPQGLQNIRLTDRDAILVRAGHRARVRWSPTDVQSAHFAVNVDVPTQFGSLTLLRGWASLDFSVDHTRARFVTTHLETVSPLVQMLQAQELVAGPANTDVPLIFVCDCNSSADGTGPDATPTYGALLDAGLADAWTATRRHDPGFTCCQAPDLTNVPSALNERIDLVLTRGDLDAQNARLTGARLSDRTDGAPPLWPSDHAGVAAKLKLHSDDVPLGFARQAHIP